MSVLICLSMLAAGFVCMGYQMTALHAYIHIGGLKMPNCPVTIKLYGWPHLQHHKEIHHEVVHAEAPPSLWKYLCERGIQDWWWVTKNLITHVRWTPARLLILAQGIVVFVLMFLLQSTIGAMCSAFAYMLGASALMYCYDLWHLWTHINGPWGGSKQHAYHHGKARESFGMWWWNQINDPEKSSWIWLTTRKLAIIERLFIRAHQLDTWYLQAEKERMGLKMN